ncbi:MAG: hypothetical protein E6Q97_25350 [Desulfurellales bacterium]|nr:MAG: hypothetical protein E6Q97_25350 [Desulfurellales bacterium]
MWVELTRNTLVDGVSREIGDRLQVEDQLGEALIYMKKARAWQPPKEAVLMNPSEVAVVGPEEKAILEPLKVAGARATRRKR